MEKLNEYLQILLSTCSYELHLEPNKSPYIVSANGATDVTNSPLLGTQISLMIFPLIPANVKQQLPNSSEVEFVLPHNLGEFSFLVKKSPVGFNVTIRPILSNQPPAANLSLNEIHPSALAPDEADFFDSEEETPFAQFGQIESDFKEQSNTLSFSGFENDFASKENLFSNTATENASVGERDFTSLFSDGSTFEPESKDTSFAPPQENFVESFLPDAEPEFGSDAGNIQFIETSDLLFENEDAAHRPAEFSTSFSPSEPQYPNPDFSQMPPAPEPSSAAKTRMDNLFKLMAEVGASDLHLSVSMPPMIRRDGKMQKLECNEPTLTPNSMRELLTSIMPEKNQEEFARRSDTDFAYEIPGLARFRANIFADRKGMGGVFRIIPTKILTAEQLGLSQAIMNLCELSKGLVVVTGPTGSGKSTTLCAMIDSINKKRDDHIITIEDPIEFVHDNQKCLVNQREVHNHTDSFKDALRAALREDPDILLVGEMRDLETISIAIETAETGHLVFGTLHTTTAASTVDRIIDQFPADRQQQIRVMLSESLKGVIAQTLLPKKGGGRVAALEVLIVTPAISNLIREGKTFQIPSAMQTGKAHGMAMLNDALFSLVQKGLVEPRDAYIKAIDKTNFEALLTRGGFKI